MPEAGGKGSVNRAPPGRGRVCACRPRRGRAMIAPDESASPANTNGAKDGPMLQFESNRGVQLCDGLTRRNFLRVGALAAGLSLTEWARLRQAGAAAPPGERA